MSNSKGYRNNATTSVVNKTSASKPSAWSNGNPLKSTNSKSIIAPPPGMANKLKKNQKKHAPNPALRERFLNLISSKFVGQNVTLVTLKKGVYKGVFHTFTPFSLKTKARENMYVLKAVQCVSKGNENEVVVNGATLIVPSSKVLEVKISSVRMTDRQQPNAMSTDTEISNAQNDGGGRDLVMASSAWTSSPMPSTHNTGAKGQWARGLSINSSNKNDAGSELSGKIGKWDQFAANKEKFGIEGDFDETVYTTALDKDSLDQDKIRRAEQVAKEIEKSSSLSNNIHVREERNQVVQGDYDEEDLYSGVLGKNKEKSEPNSEEEDAATEKDTKKDEKKEKAVEVIDEKVEDDKKEEEKEEKKIETETVTTSTTTTSDDAKTDSSTAATVSKSKLNPNAKAFSFNPTAKEFKPVGLPATAMPAPNTRPYMGAPQMYPNQGGPHMAAGIPMAMPPHVGYQQHFPPHAQHQAHRGGYPHPPPNPNYGAPHPSQMQVPGGYYGHMAPSMTGFPPNPSHMPLHYPTAEQMYTHNGGHKGGHHQNHNRNNGGGRGGSGRHNSRQQYQQRYQNSQNTENNNYQQQMQGNVSGEKTNTPPTGDSKNS